MRGTKKLPLAAPRALYRRNGRDEGAVISLIGLPGSAGTSMLAAGPSLQGRKQRSGTGPQRNKSIFTSPDCEAVAEPQAPFPSPENPTARP